MKIRRLILLLAVIVLGSVIYSCSEDESTSPSTNLQMSDYYPSTPGSWWYYKHYNIDSLGNREFQWNDSVYIGEPAMIDGHEAITRITVSDYDNEINIDTNYYYTDGSRLFIYGDSYLNQEEFKWRLYVDFSKQNWEILKEEFHVDSMYQIPNNGGSFRLKRDIIDDLTGSQYQDRNFTVKGNNITAKGIETYWLLSIYNLGFGEEYFDELVIKDHFWLAKGIGIVHDQLERSNGTVSDLREYIIELVDYHIIR
ncbi:hypothetical protein ACFLSQ_06945 [Bacteroidota bacterium]